LEVVQWKHFLTALYRVSSPPFGNGCSGDTNPAAIGADGGKWPLSPERLHMQAPNLFGGPLNQQDYDNLARSWIDRECADQNLLRRVSSPEGAQIMGRPDNGNWAGVLYPNVWPGENFVREYCLRRDVPELRWASDGTQKEHAKYVRPPGRGNLLYLPAGTEPAWLLDASLPIVITEGCKQLLALARLAWHDLAETAERPRFLAAGLYGCWNWRGVVGKAPGPNGERRDVKDAIPDLKRLVLEERRTTIVFDSDAKSNEMVRAARTALARYLVHERSAQVFFADVPAPKKGGHK
jgi:hypothetical protein